MIFSLVIFSTELDQDPDEPDEPVDHDYNVLEPGAPSDDVQENPNDKFPDSDASSEDPDLSIDPSEIPNLENNPAYAFPWKTKNVEPCVRRRANSM